MVTADGHPWSDTFEEPDGTIGILAWYDSLSWVTVFFIASSSKTSFHMILLRESRWIHCKKFLSEGVLWLVQFKVAWWVLACPCWAGNLLFLPKCIDSRHLPGKTAHVRSWSVIYTLHLNNTAGKWRYQGWHGDHILTAKVGSVYKARIFEVSMIWHIL